MNNFSERSKFIHSFQIPCWSVSVNKMRYTLTLLLLFVSLGSYAAGNIPDDESCMQMYANVNNASGNLTSKETGKFLNAIACGYFSSAEGGEFGSELIMMVLENSTNEFIVEFDKLDTSLQKVILAQVQSPIHDGFELQSIYNKIISINTPSQTKQKLLAAIKQAAKSQNTEIQ